MRRVYHEGQTWREGVTCEGTGARELPEGSGAVEHTGSLPLLGEMWGSGDRGAVSPLRALRGAAAIAAAREETQNRGLRGCAAPAVSI